MVGEKIPSPLSAEEMGGAAFTPFPSIVVLLKPQTDAAVRILLVCVSACRILLRTLSVTVQCICHWLVCLEETRMQSYALACVVIGESAVKGQSQGIVYEH